MSRQYNEQPQDLENTKKNTKWLVIFKFISRTIIFIIFIILLVLIFIFLVIYNKYNSFLQAAEIDSTEFIETLKSGLTTVPKQNNYKINFLILGVDSLETRKDIPPLTDTVMLASLGLDRAKLNLLSLPRDIWNEDYQTKINALLAYGEDRYPEIPQKFPEEVIEEMTGVDIHHTIVISLDRLAELVDLLGGVEVEIKQGFVDNQYPRSDVDIYTVTDPELLYETVEFKAGIEQMSGDKILKYIRSRYSDDDEGTDLSRNVRQQQVIMAIFNSLQDYHIFIKNPTKLGLIYKFYQNNFTEYLSISELIAIGKSLGQNASSLIINNQNISIYPEDHDGVLFHPPEWKYNGLWVFEIRDIKQFNDEIINKLAGETNSN